MSELPTSISSHTEHSREAKESLLDYQVRRVDALADRNRQEFRRIHSIIKTNLGFFAARERGPQSHDTRALDLMNDLDHSANLYELIQALEEYKVLIGDEFRLEEELKQLQWYARESRQALEKLNELEADLAGYRKFEQYHEARKKHFVRKSKVYSSVCVPWLV